MIKNKNQLTDYLNKFFFDYNDYDMPKFSTAINYSDFFKKNSKKILKFINENKTNNEDFEKLILCSYFSSTKVMKKIHILNKNNLKKNQSRFYKKIFKKKNNNKLFLK